MQGDSGSQFGTMRVPLWSTCWFVGLALITGCGPKVDDLEDLTGSESASHGTTVDVTTAGDVGDETEDPDDTNGDPTGMNEPPDCTGLPSNNNIDILFMIDDSGSMAEKQLALASNIEALIDVLDKADMNYRIAFTTSDNGNPLCPTNTKVPEGGRFVLESCRARTDHFVFQTVPPIDATQAACLDICAHEWIDIEPTTTENDPVAKPRPWVERIDGQTNLPPGMDVVEALRCFAPMGIAGCGYEEQLESVFKALARATDAGQAQYDFVRSDALLAIVLVSDEADGSYNRLPYGPDGPYDLDGNKVFWSDPDNFFPTSAVSWNAGVECTGNGAPYTECHSQNYDIDANIVPEAQAASQAVLHPVSRYTDLLSAYVQSGKGVIVMGMLGVPPGYEKGTPLVYQDAPDNPEFMRSYGIGPGCQSPLTLPGMEPFEQNAVPPVRQREFIEAFPGRLYSICESDYGARLGDIGCDIIAPAG